MKKKITVIVACVLCIVIGMITGAAAVGVVQKINCELRPDFTVKVDGNVKTFKNAQGEKVYPILYNGTTYLPVRAIGELMGKTVYWYEDSKIVELKDEQTTVTDADVIITGNGKDKQPTNNKHNDKKPEKVDGITVDEAKEIAVKKAGFKVDEVVFKKSKMDYDDGMYVWEIEFVKDKVEYSAEIQVSDGVIYSWEVDRD